VDSPLGNPPQLRLVVIGVVRRLKCLLLVMEKRGQVFQSRIWSIISPLSRKAGRVKSRLTPALPHQTMHAVFPHTAFRCSSRQGMRIACLSFISAIEDFAPTHFILSTQEHEGQVLNCAFELSPNLQWP